ncbi:Transcription initiation factor IIF subunit beta [Lachnellula hyalina]|uniref:Transcription initiation factor IIF subunit beta n=1 Tax=Lachnellula hyalina TaxID=1316788 RepID=A0A8H8R853_9HELO|nr:Transcription initiation factor IIF subunit beta [Lachnellula hyalina]TVY29792.1 Transcription initiation factor IIF subunit beta [Lachnellula hyalina]
MADLSIKPDPDAPGAGASPAAFSEEDIYEDAGDLEFNPDPNFQSLYLSKVPKYVWEAWSKLDDDAEIQIGTIRNSTVIGEDGAQKACHSVYNPTTQELTMLLSSNIAEHQPIPKEYQLDINNESVKNTFVFTEKDLPGFKSKSNQKFDPSSANMPSRLMRNKNEKPAANKPFDPNRRFQPYFRKAIPKRTTLAGKVAHELNCIPIDNPESQRLLSARTLEAMRPKMHTKFLGAEDVSSVGSGFIQPGSIAAQNQWDAFIKKPGQAGGKRPQLQKTARMPQNELLDKIFECFKKYNYWSMKALRAELQQPEAYLRETLERVAVLAKSGRFATQWSLKPENKITNYEAMGDAVAPTEGVEDSEFGDLDDDDDDEDVKFEDV